MLYQVIFYLYLNSQLKYITNTNLGTKYTATSVSGSQMLSQTPFLKNQNTKTPTKKK
jgi:hypothetical protein